MTSHKYTDHFQKHINLVVKDIRSSDKTANCYKITRKDYNILIRKK